MWIISREIRLKVFLPHSQWVTFSQLNEFYLWLIRPFPQPCPQGAHNMPGVSAHVIHTVVHRAGWCRPLAGRDNVGAPEKCQGHRLERW